MNVFLLAMLLLPMLAQDNDSQHVEAARLSTGLNIAAAAAVARDYTPPAWIVAARLELVDSPEYCTRIIAAISESAAETGLEEEMIWSVMMTETHARHWRNSGRVKRGGAGEVGVMQVLPWWTRGLKKEYDIDVDLYDLSDNIRAGAYILSRGGTEPRVMLSYYNTGQRVRSTPYQRKVMRYWDKLDTIGSPNEI